MPRPAVQIQHRDVVAAVGGELAVARHANIGAVVIHHGGGGAHAAQIDGLRAGELTGIAKNLAVEIAALGGEVYAAIRVSDVGADIAGVVGLESTISPVNLSNTTSLAVWEV